MPERKKFRWFGRKESEPKPKRLFPPLPPITLSGWVILRRDKFAQTQDGRHITRFSLMQKNTEQGYLDFIPLLHFPAHMIAWIRVAFLHQDRTFGTQLLHAGEDFLKEQRTVGLAQESQQAGTKSIFEKNGWQKVEGTTYWRSFNRRSKTDKVLREYVNDGGLYLVDYEKALRDKK